MSFPLTPSPAPSIEFHSPRPNGSTVACELRWKCIPPGTNADSPYADDDPAALMEGTYKEQVARRIAIQALEAVLSGQVSPKNAERLHKELNALRAVYRAQWNELEAAVGQEACQEVGRHVEEDQEARVGRRFDGVCQLSLPLGLFSSRPSKGLTQAEFCCANSKKGKQFDA